MLGAEGQHQPVRHDYSRVATSSHERRGRAPCLGSRRNAIIETGPKMLIRVPVEVRSLALSIGEAERILNSERTTPDVIDLVLTGGNAGLSYEGSAAAINGWPRFLLRPMNSLSQLRTTLARKSASRSRPILAIEVGVG